MCVFRFPDRLIIFSATDSCFFYCATQSFFIGDHVEFLLSKSDHFERSYEVLKTKLSKISANIDTCLKYLKRNLTQGQYKNISPFFRLPTQILLLCDSTFFLLRIIY